MCQLRQAPATVAMLPETEPANHHVRVAHLGQTRPPWSPATPVSHQMNRRFLPVLRFPQSPWKGALVELARQGRRPTCFPAPQQITLELRFLPVLRFPQSPWKGALVELARQGRRSTCLGPPSVLLSEPPGSQQPWAQIQPLPLIPR